MSQVFTNWRVVFVDGPSCREHKDYLRSLVDSDSRFSIINLSSNKGGIFGAMNVGFDSAKSNEWTMFLGSDDYLSCPDVLNDVVKVLCYSCDHLTQLLICTGIYLDTSDVQKRRACFLSRQLPGPLRLTSRIFTRHLFYGATPPHQCTFFSPQCHKGVPLYDTSFSLAADLNAFLALRDMGNSNFVVAPIRICNILVGGISHKSIFRRLREVVRCYFKAFGFFFFAPFLLRYIRKFSHRFLNQ
jgi:glycosyltransferase involved in cell wall biosynthesis